MRRFQKLDDFRKFFLFLFRSRNVGKTYFQISLNIGIGFTEVYSLLIASRHRTEQKKSYHHKHYESDNGNRKTPPRTRIAVIERKFDFFRTLGFLAGVYCVIILFDKFVKERISRIATVFCGLSVGARAFYRCHVIIDCYFRNLSVFHHI